MAVKRNYQSALRTEQREQTAKRLLEAFSALIAEGEGEITVPRVAKRAGVSAPTAYKHYPTLEALIEAYWRLPEVTWVPGELRTVAEVQEVPFQLFERFAANKTWMALVNSANGGEVSRAGKRARTRQVTQRVAEVLGPLPPETQRLVPLLVRQLTGYHHWLGLTEGLEMANEDAAVLTSWAMKLVFEELRRNPESFEEHRHEHAHLRP